jgi:peptidoglycan/xylan/chitin deacetylase (PgdA/CDA1 family)
MGQTIVLWTSDPGDRYQRSADDLVAWFTRYPPQSGEIVLLHDSAPALADALPRIIAIVRQRGLEFATVSEWLPGGRQRRSLAAPANA